MGYEIEQIETDVSKVFTGGRKCFHYDTTVINADSWEVILTVRPSFTLSFTLTLSFTNV